MTIQAFEKGVAASTTLDDNDTCTERLMKKMVEFNVIFHPFFLLMPLAFVLGRSNAGMIVLYILALLCCWLFNSFKVHRACMEHVMLRWVF